MIGQDGPLSRHKEGPTSHPLLSEQRQMEGSWRLDLKVVSKDGKADSAGG